MRRQLAIFFIFLLPLFPAFAQRHFVAMTYNVENLFDTKHDSLKDDYEFLPDAVRHWSRSRYWKKLSNISRVIVSACERQIPDVVCLCEVENDSCLFDLTRRSSLRALDYRYFVTNSADHRGIDVALLYQRGTFRPILSQSITPNLSLPVRDILYVSGRLVSGDTLDIFCVHMPSKIGGKQSTDNRSRVASLLRSKIDSVCRCRAVPSILVMGDFNDNPRSASVYEALGAKEVDSNSSDGCLVNLMIDKKGGINRHVCGTYRYRGSWETLDHVIVNGAMTSRKRGLRVGDGGASIVNLDFLLEDDSRYGGVRPFRTYLGARYHGGYSDHLPVVVDLLE